MAVAGLLLIAATIVAVRYFSRSSTQSSVLSSRYSGGAASVSSPARQALHRRPALRQHERRSQAGVFQRRYHRGHHHDLSKISSLFVIARNSAFTYKGKAIKVQDVSREMGVRYVLEGSVRKADNQVRVTAQLIDAITGGHLWSERYDRPFKDIFALQERSCRRS